MNRAMSVVVCPDCQEPLALWDDNVQDEIPMHGCPAETCQCEQPTCPKIHYK